MEKPKLSIITPVYNVENFIEKCIKSVICQSFQNWELILVDDCSPDNSPSICDRFAKDEPRIKVIHKPKNEGVSKARTSGIMEAEGDYIAFLDSDDYVHPNAYEIMVNALEKYDCDILECAYYDDKFGKITEVKKEKDVYEMTREEAFKELHSLSFNNDFLWNKLFKKECLSLEEDEKKVAIGEDYSLVIKSYEKSEKIVFINQCLYYYVFRSESVCNRGYSSIFENAIENWKEKCYYLCEKYPEIKSDVVAKTLMQEMSALTAMTKNSNVDKQMVKLVHNDVKKNYKLAKKVKMPLKIKLSLWVVKLSGSFFIFLYRLLPKKFK